MKAWYCSPPKGNITIIHKLHIDLILFWFTPVLHSWPGWLLPIYSGAIWDHETPHTSEWEFSDFHYLIYVSPLCLKLKYQLPGFPTGCDRPGSRKRGYSSDKPWLCTGPYGHVSSAIEKCPPRDAAVMKTAAELCSGGWPHLARLLLTNAWRRKETCRRSRPASRMGTSEFQKPAWWAGIQSTDHKVHSC